MKQATTEPEIKTAEVAKAMLFTGIRMMAAAMAQAQRLKRDISSAEDFSKTSLLTPSEI